MENADKIKSKTFQKTLDKSKIIWYNIYRVKEKE
jgi:hypothetical protein